MKKPKLKLDGLKVRSFVVLEPEQLEKISSGVTTAATEASSVNTQFTKITDCCCSYTCDTSVE